MIYSLLLAASLLSQTPPQLPTSTQDQGPVSAQEKRHKQDIQNDIDTGKKYAEQVEKELKLSTNKEAIERVERIGSQLAKIANQPGIIASWGDKRLNPFPYSFKVLEGKDVNAFSLPGGYLYFYEGLLDFVESDDELAGVVGHEISHSAFRHLATIQREQSKLQLAQIPLILAAILSGGKIGTEALQVSTLVTQAMSSGWSVKAEQSSDYGAFQLMSRSSYNPVGMLTFMERLSKKDRAAEGAFDWGIYRTHPPGRERAQAMVAHLKKAGTPIKRSVVSTSFRVSMKEVSESNMEAYFAGKRIAVFGGTNAKARSQAALTELNNYFDEVPAMFEIKADGNRILGGRQLLFTVDQADADAAKIAHKELTADTVKNVKNAVYSINYRVWDSR